MPRASLRFGARAGENRVSDRREADNVDVNATFRAGRRATHAVLPAFDSGDCSRATPAVRPWPKRSISGWSAIAVTESSAMRLSDRAQKVNRPAQGNAPAVTLK
jgi:hypothetical protein